ncbi:UNVERIFIED_CONTAM: hypothetical protein K2H54_033906 [Gekko kuhli]
MLQQVEAEKAKVNHGGTTVAVVRHGQTLRLKGMQTLTGRQTSRFEVATQQVDEEKAQEENKMALLNKMLFMPI